MSQSTTILISKLVLLGLIALFGLITCSIAAAHITGFQIEFAYQVKVRDHTYTTRIESYPMPYEECRSAQLHIHNRFAEYEPQWWVTCEPVQ